MPRKCGILSKAYEKVWRKTGKKPWSCYLRESWETHPLMWLSLSCVLGMFLGHLFWSLDEEDCREDDN